MIPLTVLGGYLGAGKTTIINKLLNAPHQQRIAVLVNDLGDVNIDATLIRNAAAGQAHGPIVELTNGCICCSVQDELGLALESVRTSQVDHAIIEASGVALPAKVADYGNTWPGYRLAATLVAVDASNIARQRRDKFIRHLVADQLSQADLLLVTKLDLMAAENSRIVLDSLPKPYVETINGDLPRDVLLDPPPGTMPRSARGTASAEHPHFQTFSATTEAALHVAAVEDLLQSLPTAVVRAKGWFHDPAEVPWLVQCVGARKSLLPYDLPPTGCRARMLFIATADRVPPADIAELIARTTGANTVSWI